jgi:hypothetical protein
MSQKEFELYRFEYIYQGERNVDWVWLKGEEETRDYMASETDIAAMTYRKASDDEVALYEEAFEDGRGLGIAETRMELSNGVVFRLESFTADEDGIDMKTTKMFTCGECGTSSLDFEVKAATTGDYFVSFDKEGTLWHICTDCASDCRHDWTHFSSEVCKCGSIHNYCDTCGEAINCELDSDISTDSPYRRKKKDN